MRALVAESNVVTRVMLTRILERTGFDVSELRDELAATCLLYNPDPPELALLSLDTLLVDFAQVCSVMREAKPEVFIVALVPENRRHDVGTVLDAGADDFVMKPATIEEAEARLRIVRRMLMALGGSTRPAEASLALATVTEETVAPALNQLLTDLDFPLALRTVFDQLELGPVRQADGPTGARHARFSAWAPMLLLQHPSAHWLNLRIDLNDENARRLFKAVQRSAVFTEGGLYQLLGEIMNLVQDGLRMAVLQYEGARVHVPAQPVALPPAQIPPPQSLASSYARHRNLPLQLGENVRLRLVLSLEPIPLERRLITDLLAFDVLADDIRSSEYDIVLLRAGTMLNDDYIARINAFIHSRNLSQEVTVFHPPHGTAAFLFEQSQ